MSTSLVLSLLVNIVSGQLIEGWGTSGGNGPKGGIGDLDNPVLKPQSFITDTFIPPPDAVTTRRLAKGEPPRRVRAQSVSCDQRSVVVDSSPAGARQEMLGFGFAWTDSTVSNFNRLEPNVLDQVMKDLFSREGNNMGFMRHTIGSSDLSGDQYSYDDNGPTFNLGKPDPELVNFSLGPYGKSMAKMIAKMGQYKSDVTVYGSAWSLPGWMKNNGLLIAPNLKGGYNVLNNSFNANYTQSAARYFTKYIDAFKQHGVEINGLSLMNEPLNYQGGYPCMYLDPVDAAAILNSGLAKDLAQRNVKLLSYDHNTDQPVYPYRVSQSAPIDAVAWHCYQSPSANYSVLDDFSTMVPRTPQFMTECSSYRPDPGQHSSWIAQHFIGPVRHGASGGTFWVMATDTEYGPHSPYGGCDGCLGAIIVNSSTTYTKTHDYYMMGQFSRFVRRGAFNHDVVEGYEGDGSTPDAQFYVMAVQNPDSSWAVVFMNNLKEDQEVALSFTDQPGEIWEGVVSNSSVATWLIPAKERLQEGTGALPHYRGGGATGQKDCPPKTSSGAPASTSDARSRPLLPVPDTDREL